MRRFFGVLLLLCGLGWGIPTAVNLRDAFSLEADFSGQANDYALQSSTAGNGLLSGIAGAGAYALGGAAQRVREKEQEDEIELAIAGAGILLGSFLLLKRRPVEDQE